MYLKWLHTYSISFAVKIQPAFHSDLQICNSPAFGKRLENRNFHINAGSQTGQGVPSGFWHFGSALWSAVYVLHISHGKRLFGNLFGL